jgi:hypothetical protein
MFQSCFCSHSHSRSRSPSSYLSPLPSTFIPFSTSTLPSYSSFFSPLVPHNTFLAFFSFRSTILFRRRCNFPSTNLYFTLDTPTCSHTHCSSAKIFSACLSCRTWAAEEQKNAQVLQDVRLAFSSQYWNWIIHTCDISNYSTYNFT